MHLFSLLRERFHPLHHLRKSSLFRTLIQRFDPPLAIKLPYFQRRIYLRLITHASIALANETLEPGIRRTFSALLAHFPPAGEFWDVGANIGLFTFAFAETHRVRPVLSVEPDQKNLVCLRKTSAAWNLPAHTILPEAAGDYDGEVVFYLDEASGATGSVEGPGNSFTSIHFGARQHSLTVPMKTLDSLAAQRGSWPAVLKIDVEGSEGRVLKGARNIIRERHPIILFESFEHRDECAALLRAAGYSLFDADEISSLRPQTTNFLAVTPPELAPALLEALRGLGYPIAA